MSRPAARRRGSARPSAGPNAAGKRARQKAKTSRGKLPQALAAGALVLLAAACALFAWSVSPGAVTGEGGQPIHFEVVSSDKGAVIEQLAQDGLLTAPILTKMYALLLTPTASFEPRSHLLTPGISARELVQRLSELGSRPHVKVTFPEGWTHLSMATRLESAHICSELGFRAAVHDEALLQELGLSRSAEGFLFPASYQFLVDSDPRQIVRRMVTEARKRFATLRQAHDPNKDLERARFLEADVFTLASIVEKETSIAHEAPRVARVFLNRLLHPEAETRGRLQSDPTAVYGCLLDPMVAPSCARLGKMVTPEMLNDSANPYNTYRHAGLPPGPISNPGVRALAAVLSPSEGSDLYFVADGDGTHTFSETYAQHLKAVEILRARRNPKKIE